MASALVATLADALKSDSAKAVEASEVGPSFFFTGVGVCSPEDDLGMLARCSPTYKNFWLPVLEAEGDATRLEVLGQLALQTSLADLWCGWGVSPGSTAGHSLGELPAAYAAGMYSLEEVAALGRWVADAMGPSAGWMAAGVGLTPTAGAHMASKNFVDTESGKLHSSYCGKEGAWDTFAAANPAAKKLHVRHCWHHPKVQLPAGPVPVESSAPSKIPFWASSQARVVEKIEAGFWEDWLRKPVDASQFKSSAIAAASPPAAVVEIGAHPTAAVFLPAGVPVVPSMHRDFESLPFILQQRARLPAVAKALENEVMAVFGAFDSALPWLEQGMGSAALTQTASRLAHYFPGLAPADLYSHRSLADLIERYGRQPRAGAAGVPRAPAGAGGDARVLIAGLGCWLPGGIGSPGGALDFFARRGDAITVRKELSPHGCGYIADFPFEFAKFGLKPNEARCMDPQQALAMLAADLAVADSGIGAAALAGPRTGVYLGAWNQDFQGERSSAYDVVGSNPSLITARVSSHWDLRGPSVLVNTACASSLECVVRALGDLRLGRVDVALVGGVNVIQDPEFTERMKRGGFLGDSCRCKTFDATADGYVRSEGAVVAVLVRSDAPALEGAGPDRYYAEVLGAASNHNGRSPLITVPSAEAQAELITAACRDAGIAPGDLDAVECHGTGTRIGDPIEVSGIAQALQSGAGESPEKPLYLTSAKSNVGHLESAAGAVGLLRAALSAGSETVFGNPLLQTLNPGLKLPSRCRAVTDTVHGARLEAIGISSFGFGGSNAHVVVGRPGMKAAGPAGLELPTAESAGVLMVRKQPPAVAARPTLQPLRRADKRSLVPDAAKAIGAMVEQTIGAPADLDVPLLDLGLDSLGITDLFMQVTKHFGVDLQSVNLHELASGGLTVRQMAHLMSEEGAPEPSTVGSRRVAALQGSTTVGNSDNASDSSFAEATHPPGEDGVLARLAAILADMGHEDASPELPLLEVGLDSLAITDFAMQASRLFDCAELQAGRLAESSLQALAAAIANAGGALAPVCEMAPALVAQGKPKAPETLEAFDYYLTRPLVDPARSKILTSHVGSLPSSFGTTSHEHIFQQIDIGLDVINDGEVHRRSYVDETLSRLTGFALPGDAPTPEASMGSVPQDVSECPDCARRFMGRSSLITLNKRFPARNPCCVGPVAYTDDRAIKEYLDEFEAALRQNGTEPSSAFYSVPSPGTLALFFKNTHYATEDEYLGALAKALAVEYREIVRRGFTLQVDCPDLAMGRHTQFQKLSNREFLRMSGNLIRHLNAALEGLPKSQVRVHICWGNYGFSHHRDIPLALIVDQLNDINCQTMLLESANPRHQHEIDVMGRLKSAVVCLGCVDTSSPHVESPHLIAKRLVELAQTVGPWRVMAGTDCGFATTSEGGANTEIVFMKLRSLVQGARLASSELFPDVPKFQPRSRVRVYWFGDEPESVLPGCEVRYVPESLELAAVARHMRSYTDIPAFFVVKEAQTSTFAETRASQLKSMLEGTAAYPKDTIVSGSTESIAAAVCEGLTFDRSRLCLPERLLAGTPGAQACGGAAPAGEYDVVVVGAGITGMHVARELQSAGVKVCLLERNSRVGGIWATFANDRSQVNSSEAAYRLLDKTDANKDHSTTREILTDCLAVASGLGESLFLQAEVQGVSVDESTELRYGTQLAGGGPLIRSRGLVLAINDRVGVPRAVRWPGQERFKGEVRDGFSNSAADLNWVGKKVVIVGMGAFATENLRTAMECGASHVTILARRHGTVCPKYIDYINFVNKDASCCDSSLSHDSVTNTKNMITWRDLYDRTGAKMPECWMKEIKHYGHTISVSDIWFIGHHLRILDSVADDIDHFEEDGVVLKGHGLLEADIVIRCTGFERNAQLVPKLTPYTQVNSCNYLDRDCMYLADALLDDNVFNSVFGSSVLELARVFCSVYLYFWKNPADYELVRPHLAKTPVEQRKWSDYIAGLDLLCAELPGVRELAVRRVSKRRSDFLRAHTVEEYLRENRREWNELHSILGIWSEETAFLPYPRWSAQAQSAA
jgi:3-oxoacyl-(acyl-carrier-protein) synthase/methionine synthase II (cobalamin-independent)/acyl carrier protein